MSELKPRAVVGALLTLAMVAHTPRGFACGREEVADTSDAAVTAFAAADAAIGRERIEKARDAEEAIRRASVCLPCHPHLAAMLGESLEDQRRFVDAEGVYRDHIETCKDTTREVRDALDHLRALPQVTVSFAPAGIPDVAIDVDGVPLADLRDPGDPADRVRLEPGAHVVRATARGCRDASESVDLAASASMQVKLTLSPAGPSGASPPHSPGPARTLATIGLAAGAAFLVGGIIAVLWGTDNVKSFNGDARCVPVGTPGNVQQPAFCQSWADTSNTLRVVSTSFFLGSGVLGAASAVIFMTSPPPGDHPTRDPRIECRTVGVLGIGCQGSF
jgi:hypothetical protein